MVNQREALNRLNKEKAYEDKIARDLLNYYIVSLDEIPDMNEEDKKKIKAVLSKIAHESEMHSSMFDNLITYVLNNGEAEY